MHIVILTQPENIFLLVGIKLGITIIIVFGIGCITITPISIPSIVSLCVSITPLASSSMLLYFLSYFRFLNILYIIYISELSSKSPIFEQESCIVLFMIHSTPLGPCLDKQHR
jgi:hypothetical protein